MTTKEIEQFLYDNTCLSKSDTIPVSKSLSRLFIQDKIDLLTSTIWSDDLYNYTEEKIKQLKKELKELE